MTDGGSLLPWCCWWHQQPSFDLHVGLPGSENFCTHTWHVSRANKQDTRRGTNTLTSILPLVNAMCFLPWTTLCHAVGVYPTNNSLLAEFGSTATAVKLARDDPELS
ncbi:hypothetical protein FALCPG4_000674 [Fusarium falciforme]